MDLGLFKFSLGARSVVHDAERTGAVVLNAIAPFLWFKVDAPSTASRLGAINATQVFRFWCRGHESANQCERVVYRRNRKDSMGLEANQIYAGRGGESRPLRDAMG